jgi:hypothetical protein
MTAKNTSSNRRASVLNTLASLRIEGLEPSEKMIKELDAYIAGNKTIEEIIEQTKERYRLLHN